MLTKLFAILACSLGLFTVGATWVGATWLAANPGSNDCCLEQRECCAQGLPCCQSAPKADCCDCCDSCDDCCPVCCCPDCPDCPVCCGQAVTSEQKSCGPAGGCCAGSGK